MTRSGKCFLPAVFLLAALLGSAAVQAAESPQPGTIQIAGTGSAIGTMKLLADAFHRLHPDLRVVVLPSVGSSGGIRAVAKGAADIGVISRGLTEDEQKLGLHVTAYAETPFVFVTRDNVPLANLSLSDIARIYRGEMQTWPSGERIRLILRPVADVDTVMARSLSLEMNAAMDAALGREGMLTAMTDQDCITLLESTPGAAAFATLAQVVAEKRRVKVLSLDNRRPEKAVRDRSAYPYYKTLSLVLRQDGTPAARRFLEFLRSSQGRSLLEAAGNRPLLSGGTR
jgi:phosphate transport system substrate-binding protein